MQVSKRFLALLEQQLAQFADRPDLRSLVVYLALPGETGKPALVAIGQWPHRPALPPDPLAGVGGIGDGPPNAASNPQDSLRWLPLRDGALVSLGPDGIGEHDPVFVHGVVRHRARDYPVLTFAMTRRSSRGSTGLGMWLTAS